MNLRQRLMALRPAIAAAAQKVVDEWQLDEEGLDPELGAGGVCDLVASAIISVVGQLDGVEATCGSQPGEDHEWVVASDGYSAFLIDIPPGVYEVGGGYSWRKIEGAEVASQDVVIEPVDLGLAQDLLKEGGRMHKLTVLAEALEALGETNSAMLVRVLGMPQLVREAQGWADKFFKANPQLLDRAEQFAEAKGISVGQYLGYLEQLPEDMGRSKVHQDLGYVNMPWSPTGKPPEKKLAPEKPEPRLQPEAELRWPFPPPNVLQDENAFIAAALAWSMGEGQALYARMYGKPGNLRDMGRKGEVQAARAYLRHLMKDVTPRLAATLQAKWKDASAKGDTEAQHTLRAWWSSLSDVWGLIQRMVGNINDYEFGA